MIRTIEAFIANNDNDIFANTFKNFALRDYEAVFVCGALRVGMLLVRLAINKFLRHWVCSKR